MGLPYRSLGTSAPYAFLPLDFSREKTTLMINAVLAKVFGTKHERELKRMQPVVAEINALEPGIKKLSDENLRKKFTGKPEDVVQFFRFRHAYAHCAA